MGGSSNGYGGGYFGPAIPQSDGNSHDQCLNLVFETTLASVDVTVLATVDVGDTLTVDGTVDAVLDFFPASAKLRTYLLGILYL